MILLNIGYSNSVRVEEVQAILNYNSAPLRRLVKELDKVQKVLDATSGKTIRSIVSLRSGMVILSAIDSMTLFERFTLGKKPKTQKTAD